ncbi:hypothetical protein I7I53_04759 [Histoplasma capsulatum var. duboisii H88]|uniref:Secreted protein n=1 Tax=Ajellomyces capsulatus (strain H88) TaxID=544711 RepID=A0A8A1LT95_AJEC8|nr:hypothetical protein I7I53_04759 [Histoplasma capsulatum var. duboisii H88]
MSIFFNLLFIYFFLKFFSPPSFPPLLFSCPSGHHGWPVSSNGKVKKISSQIFPRTASSSGWNMNCIFWFDIKAC